MSNPPSIHGELDPLPLVEMITTREYAVIYRKLDNGNDPHIRYHPAAALVLHFLFI
jgi:hypothetical protein